MTLIAESQSVEPPHLRNSTLKQSVSPGEVAYIPGQLYNPNSFSIRAALYLNQQLEKDNLLAAHEEKPFTLKLPIPSAAPNGEYPYRIEAIGAFAPIVATGQVIVLPVGELRVQSDCTEQKIPERREINQSYATATFQILLNNQSNTQPSIKLAVQPLQRDRSSKHSTIEIENNLNLLPAGQTVVPLKITHRLPWIGGKRLRKFQITAEAIGTVIPLHHSTQQLHVYLRPIIPVRLQLLLLLLTLGLSSILSLLFSNRYHEQTVTSVQFNGQGTEVISSSLDQTFRRWKVENEKLYGRYWSAFGTEETSIDNHEKKSLRLARYRPVNHDQVAIGFENGTIELLNLLTGQKRSIPLQGEQDQRVFGLVFSEDARKLYSGHSSGMIFVWDLSTEETVPPRLQFTNVGFQIQSMALTNRRDSSTQYLAVGGQYNRLMLVELGTNYKRLVQNYPKSTNKSDLITSVSTTQQAPHRVAVSDSQGNISLWDVDECWQQRGNCSPVWKEHENAIIYSVALTADACFLVSGNDDGQVKLWSLEKRNQVDTIQTHQSWSWFGAKPASVTAVDVIQTPKSLLVVSGDANGDMKATSIQFKQPGSVDRCPTLTK